MRLKQLATERREEKEEAVKTPSERVRVSEREKEIDEKSAREGTRETERVKWHDSETNGSR